MRRPKALGAARSGAPSGPGGVSNWSPQRHRAREPPEQAYSHSSDVGGRKPSSASSAHSVSKENYRWYTTNRSSPTSSA